MEKHFGFLIILCLCLGILGCSIDSNSPEQQNENIIQTQEPIVLQEDTTLEWEIVEDGISFSRARILSEDTIKEFMIVKIDPKRFSFEVFENKDQDDAKNIREIHEKEQSVFTFNGSFFSEDFQPIAFLKSNGKVLHKISKADLVNGIFAVFNDGKAKLYETEKFKDSSKITFAIQNGPVLLDEQGKVQILSDSGKMAGRTAIGLDKDGHIIIIVLQQSFLHSNNTITLYQFAHLLKEAPVFGDLQFHSFLNLDGGPSTGMMIKKSYYPELSTIQNVITVKKKV